MHLNNSYFIEMIMPYSKISEILISSSKLLLVDDVPQNLQYLAVLLRDKGFQISLASNGEQAINLAQANLPDLMLLDIAMPGIDGFEVCRILKSSPETSSIPIIFLTAKTDSETVEHAFEIGGVDYVTKPFNPKELMLRIVNHLELKYHRDNLQKINNQLIDSNNEKDRFLSLISHDIRSPFHGLLGISQILKENIDRLQISDIKEYVELLDEGLHNQFNFLNNIINWGKLRQGKMEFVPARIEIAELIYHVLKTLKLNLEHKRINIDIRIEGEQTVIVDRNLIAELFHNILSNSIKFTKHNGNIEMSLIADTEGFSCSIKDNGIGISKEILDMILNEGKAYTSLGTDKESGHGFGLILCRDIVNLHNGALGIESELEEGTIVAVKIPNYGIIE